MEPTKCQLNQEDTDFLMPPEFKNLNRSSSSSSSNSSNESTSSYRALVQAHLDKLIASVDPNMSPQELVEASSASLAIAEKEAKKARALANHKALVAAKAVAEAKKALEQFHLRFPQKAMYADLKVPRVYRDDVDSNSESSSEKLEASKLDEADSDA